jgi:hypothetical protein
LHLRRRRRERFEKLDRPESVEWEAVRRRWSVALSVSSGDVRRRSCVTLGATRVCSVLPCTTRGSGGTPGCHHDYGCPALRKFMVRQQIRPIHARRLRVSRTANCSNFPLRPRERCIKNWAFGMNPFTLPSAVPLLFNASIRVAACERTLNPEQFHFPP